MATVSKNYRQHDCNPDWFIVSAALADMQAFTNPWAELVTLDNSIEMSARFTRWYVNKGAVPYADDLPFDGHG